MSGEAVFLAAHRPLPLDDPAALWIVEEGEVLVFAGPRGGETARPCYLLMRQAGEALIGGADEAATGLVGIALASARVRKVTQAEMKDLEPAQRARISEGLDGWVLGLASAFKGLVPRGAATRLGGGSNEVELSKGQVLEGSPGRVCWLEMTTGSAAWMGVEGARIDGASGLVPLVEGTWIEATEAGRCRVRAGDRAADLEAYLAATRRLQRLVLFLLEDAERARDEALIARAKEREHRGERRVQHALDSLAHLIGEGPAPELFDGPPIYRACAAAAVASGMPFPAPRTDEDPVKERNPVAAVARRSNVRCRQVLLRDRWHEEEGGPMVAFLEANGAEGAAPVSSGQPVALLPDGPGRYVVYDPVADTRVPLTPEIEARLERQAYVLYPPLPDGFSARPGALLGFALHGLKKDIVVLLLVGIAATLLGMLVPHATSFLIDVAIPGADRGLAVQIGLALLMTAVGRMLFELSRTFATLRLSVGSSHRVQASLMDRLLKLRVSFFRRYTVGDLLDRVMAVQKMFQQLSMTSLVAVLAGVFTLINFILLLYYSWLLALYAASMAILCVLATWFTGRQLVREDRTILEKSAAAFGHVVQLVQGVSKIRVAAAEDRAFASWARRYRENQFHVLARQAIDDRLTVMNAMLPLLGQLFLFWIALGMIRPDEGQPELTLGTFLAFQSAFGMFLGGVTSLSNTVTDVLGILMLWERARPILEAEPEVGGRRTQPGRLKGGVSLQRVTFRYREDCAPVLEEMSVEANPGEFVALVGPSGCGKSTTLRLLLGFEAPERGKVIYDGQDLADLDVDAVRRQIGVVLQTSRVRSNSIFENIAAGAVLTMEEAWEAARKAAFDEDIRRMPMGMHTVVSEGGTNLSGGQRQRLLIARALAKRPRLLLFDEATSALDNRSQSIVTHSLAEAKVTRVVVAHRPSTIRGADRIYVFEKGRVVQTGSFEELARVPGAFQTLMTLSGGER